MAGHYTHTGFQRTSDGIPAQAQLDDSNNLKVNVVAGGTGGGAATIADGADVAEGSTADVAWVSGAGTVISLLKKIASAGGSAVSIADGADVTQGAVADAAYSGSGSGTVISILKRIAAWTGFTGLTDTQLRATPVPVSGTVTTGGLTDTQLRATPVPVSGTVTATGPLTDTQLRATPVPVSGTVTANAGTNLNTSLLALDATSTNRTQKSQVTDGTRDGTVKAASTLPLLTDTALVTTQRDPLPAGTNVIGHVITDTGSTTAVTGTVAVTGGLTDTQLRATPVPISAASLPLPTLASTSTLQTSGNASLTSIDTKLTSPLAVTLPVVAVVTGNLVTNGDTVTIDTTGAATVQVGVTANTSTPSFISVVPEASIDGTNFFQPSNTFVPSAYSFSSNSYLGISSDSLTAPQNLFLIHCAGFKKVRVKMFGTLGAGLITIQLNATLLTNEQPTSLVGQAPNSGNAPGGSVSGWQVAIGDNGSGVNAVVKNNLFGAQPATITDSALVVAVSPTSPLPPGTNALGSVIASGTVATTIATGADVDLTRLLAYALTQQADTLEAIRIELRVITALLQTGLSVTDSPSNYRNDPTFYN